MNAFVFFVFFVFFVVSLCTLVRALSVDSVYPISGMARRPFPTETAPGGTL